MLKVFLVEDEIVMREGIKNNINWEREGFEFVGEASDGELAYPMIQKLCPDIMITDIKMPFMDGLELSRLVKKEMPHVKIIILSGYNEFDYAKEAISIGVTDYLLKPISSVKLLEAVKNVQKIIDEEIEQQRYLEQFRQEMMENEHIEQQKFFNELISNKLSMSEILEKGKKLDIDLSARYFNIVLYKVMLTEEEDMDYSEEVVSVCDKIDKGIREKDNVDVFDRGAEGFAFLIKGETEKELTEFRDYGFTKLQQIMDGHPGIGFFVGVGNIVQRLRELPEAYDEANKAFSYRYLVAHNQIVYSESIGEVDTLIAEEEINLNTLDLGKIDRRVLQSFLKRGLIEEAKHFLNDYFISLGAGNMQSLLFRQYIAMDMYFCTIAFIEELGYGADIIQEKIGDVNAVAAALSTSEQTKAFLENIIANALSLRDAVSLKKYGTLIDDAKQYIQDNYDKEEISLNRVAASVNISPSHFSTIFSQEEKKTFIEYLTEVRMEKAKELLRCELLPVK